MRIYDVILKKRDGNKLSKEEIKFVVSGVSNKTIPDYQIAAFLMASFIQGLDAEETSHLTKYMMESGDILDLSNISKDTVDKHSTGGVGDKLSLILAPAVAAGGGIVPMMSGRGLGHTGGTLDKLEAIPGYRIGLSEEEFREALQKVGLAIIGQTGSLAPADKKLYAMRDVTATVDSIPLITGSIMSKKFAAGPANIVMDVKWGSGAFMKTIKDAQALASSLTSVGKIMNRKVTAFITDMNQPLGRMVGNALEIKESVEALQGNGPEDVMELSRALSGEMLYLSGNAKDYKEGCAIFDRVIADGSAFKKFTDMVANQGGDISCLTDTSKLNIAKEQVEIKADSAGYIQSMDSVSIGIAGIMLGGGREKSEDEIDHSVGIEVLKKTGEQVSQGDPIARMYVSGKSRTEEAVALYKKSVEIGKKKKKKPKLIVEKIS